MDHIAANGLSDVSLRELATAVGSSHRMLIYHFGSRAGLVTAVVKAIEQDQRDALHDLVAAADGPAGLIRAMWARVSDPRLRPFVRLFFEVLPYALYRRPGTETFLDGVTAPWLTEAAETARALGTPATEAEIRLGIAVIRGLLVDLLASDDLPSTTEALERFIELWETGVDVSRDGRGS